MEFEEGPPPPAPTGASGEHRPGDRRPDGDRRPPRQRAGGREERSGKPRPPGRSEHRPDSRPAGPPRRGDRSPRAGHPREAEKTSKPPMPASKPAPPSKALVPAARPLSFREELGGSLLASVSRSFFLSLRLLPEPLRDPISLGYLLARALDTVADTAPIPAGERLARLGELAEAVKLGAEPGQLRPFQRELAPKQTHKGERELLTHLDRCLAWLDSLDTQDRWEVRRTVARIAHGQELDLRRFGIGDGAKGEIKALETVGDLDDYTYFVAGSAGEFWTRLCERHVPGYRKLEAAEMLELGRRFGQGLQLVNILRDLPADLASGRCYLPAEELTAAGLSVLDLTREPQRARPLLAKWRRTAIAHLDAGWRYVHALKPANLRYACALPILIGIRTLALLAKTSPLETHKRVKVPKLEVRALMLSTGVGLVSNRWLDGLYTRTRRQAIKDQPLALPPQ